MQKRWLVAIVLVASVLAGSLPAYAKTTQKAHPKTAHIKHHPKKHATKARHHQHRPASKSATGTATAK